MGFLIQKNAYKKIALAFSLCALMLWCLLGAGASLAWFTDTDEEIHNIFHFSDFDLQVSHQLPDGSWEEVNDRTAIFDDNALYEPGYVQVSYLKVENKGDIPFEFFTGVNVNGYALAENALGQTFSLQDYLRFGITVSQSEAEMKASVADREMAVPAADRPLLNYETDTALLQAGETRYIAIVVRMPEKVGNLANYRGTPAPMLELGITVKAQQLHD